MDDLDLDHSTIPSSSSCSPEAVAGQRCASAYLENLTTQVIETLNRRDWTNPLLQQITPHVKCMIQEHNVKHRRKGTSSYNSIMRTIFDDEGVTTVKVLNAQATIDGEEGQVWTLLKVRNANELLKDKEIETVIVYYWKMFKKKCKKKGEVKGDGEEEEWLMTGFEAINGVPPWVGFGSSSDVEDGGGG